MGKLLYAANMGDDTVSVIDEDTLTVTDTIRLGGGRAGIGKISGRGDRLVLSGLYDSSLISLDLQTRVERRLHVCSYPSDVCLYGEHVFAACADSNSVLMLTENGELIASLSCGVAPVSLCAGGGKLFCAHEISRDVCVISPTELYLLDRLVLDNTPACVLCVGERLLVACIDCRNTSRGCLCVYDASLRCVTTMALGEVPNHLAYAEGKAYAVNSADGSMSICDIERGEVRTVKTGGLPHSVCCTDRYIYVSDVLGDGVTVFDIDTYARVKMLKTGCEPMGLYAR